MRFYVAEKNIGPGTCREDVDELIRRLRDRGWEVAYGERANEITDPAEAADQQAIMDRFADDFMACLTEMGK